MTQEYKKQKFKELLVYVCEKMGGQPTFGDKVLNKVLAEIEWRAYETLGSSVSGQRFQRNFYGPTSDMLMPVRREMDQDLKVVPRDHFGYRQDATIALRKADLREFSDDEIAVMDEVIGEYSGLDGKEAQEKIYKERKGFQAWGNGEIIPYPSVFLAGEELTEEDKVQVRSA